MSKLKAQVVGIFTLMAVIIACMGLMAYVPVHADITTWSELQAAFEAGGEVTLTQDITSNSEDDGPLVVPEGKSVTLDLKGHTIDRGLYNSTMTDSEIAANKKENGSVITVYGTFTLKDTSDDGDGKITGGNTSGSGGGIYVGKDARLEMFGGNISGNTASKSGGGVYNSSNAMIFYMVGGTISRNIASESGGGVFIDGDSMLCMESGTISENMASVFGGGVYVSEYGFLLVSGNVQIFNNVKIYEHGESIAQNVYRNPGGRKILVSGELTDGAIIGVTVFDDSRFATGDGRALSTTDVSHFTCDTYESLPAILDNDNDNYNGFAFFKINGWEWLQYQFNNASTDGTLPTVITLYRDVEASETDNALTFPTGKYVILDLNGHTIDRGRYKSTMTDEQIVANSESYGYVIEVAGNLTLKDSSDEQTGKITGGNNSSNGGGVYVKTGATFTMEGGTICENKAVAGGGILVNGNFVMIDGNITGNSAGTDGGGVNADGGTFTMEGGMISGNKINQTSGGGVCIHPSSTFVMKGGTISGNIAAIGGSGVCIKEYKNKFGTFVISGSVKITGNKCGDTTRNVCLQSDGVLKVAGELTDGAEIGMIMSESCIFAESYGDYNISSADISHFTCDTDDILAAVFNDDHKVLFKKVNWKWLQKQINNASEDETSPTVITLDDDIVASEDDSALTIPSGKYITLDLKGHTIDRGLSNSDPEADGYVIRVEGNLTLKDSSDAKTGTITGGNGYSGGGVFIGQGGEFTLNGGTISGNAGNAGGGVFIGPGGEFTLNGGTISGNAGNAGGGVYVRQGGEFTLNGGTISENISLWSGGGVLVDGTFIMENGVISGNIVEENDEEDAAECGYGGGVCVEFGSFTMNDGTISENSALCGGGVYIQDGTFTMNKGVISENIASEYGGGVCVVRWYEGTFVLSGDSQITDNKLVTLGDEVLQNVYLDGKHIFVAGELADGAKIGVTVSENSIFAEGYDDYDITADDIAHFTCDTDDNLVAALNTDGKVLFIEEVHDWGWLQNKFDNASENSAAPTVITLDNDIKASETDNQLSIPSGKYVILDLNGHTIDRGLYTGTMSDEEIAANYKDDGSVIIVNGNLTLKDDITNGTGMITGGNSYEGGGVCVKAGGTFTMEGGNISENKADYGGGVIILKNGTFTLKDGEISNNFSLDCGGGVHVRNDGTFTMQAGKISGNFCEDLTGGVHNSGTFSMSGGTISENTASRVGGVYVSGDFYLSGNVLIADNKEEYDNEISDSNVSSLYSPIIINGKFTGTTPVGISCVIGYAFATGDGYDLTSEDLAWFKWDYDNCIFVLNEEDNSFYAYSDVSEIEINNISDMQYTGSEIKPDFTLTSLTYEDEEINDLYNYYLNENRDEYFTVSYTDNIDVGTATITLTGKGDFAGTTQTTFEITPKPVTVSLEVSNKVYDGTTDATVTGTPVIDGVVGNDVVGISDGTAKFIDKNVGTGKAVTFSGYSLTGVDAGNYSLKAQPANVTANITKANATVKALSAAKSLGEADPTLEATVTGVASGETINYTLARAEGENVGEYDITVTLGENQNYNVTVENAKFTISEVIAKVITAPTANTFAYDGKEHELVTAGVADTAMEYSLDGTTFTSEIPKKKDAGTYRVYFRAAADGNHTVGTIGNDEASITRINATVTAISTGKVVNETDPLLTANVTGLIGTDSVNYTVTRESGEELGSYAITVTGDAVQGNYNVTYVNGTFTIAINKITPSVTLGYESVVYDGTEKKPAVTVTSNGTELSADDYTVSYSNNTNAGTATVTVSAKEGSDYTFEAVSVNFAITKASAPANVPETVMSVASDCEKLSDVALITDWSWENGETALVEGQAVSAKAVYSGSDASNFETVSVTIEVTRAKKEHVHTIGTEKLDEKAPSCTEKGSYILRKFCTDCNVTISSETITVDATGHTFVNGVCSSCGAKENADNNEGENNNNNNNQHQGSDSNTQQGSSSDTQQTNNNSNTQQTNNQQQGSGSSSQQTNNNSNTQQSNNQQQGSGSGSQQGSGSDNKPSGSKDPAPVVTQNADGTATKTETKETKDGTKETVATTTDANGKIIQIVTERVSTDEKGNETKKVTTVNPDGTSNSEQTLTNASGKVIETVKESVKTDVQGTQTDKSVTEKISGTIIESTMITFPSGSSKTNTVEKQKDGTVTTTDISQKKNGSYTSEQTVNNVDGSSVTENAKVNAKGNLTSYSKETVASSGAKTTTHYYVKQQVKVSGGVIKAGEMHLGKVITNATQYKVPKYATVNGKKYYITAITAKSFAKCKKIKKIILGKKIKSIEKGAFANLSENAKIVIKVDKKGTFLRIKGLVIAAGFTNEDNIIWSKK